MIRAFFMWLERWAMDDESMFDSLGKICLLVAVVLGTIITPLVWYANRSAKQEQAKCLASGNVWATIGSHYQTIYMQSGKVLVPITSRVTDYGCISRVTP